jgi:FixJ family two-component response regulator
MHHHGKIDCGQVMSELNGGKKAKEVATDMKISTSSVYRCKKKEVAEAKKPETAPATTSAVKK